MKLTLRFRVFRNVIDAKEALSLTWKKCAVFACVLKYNCSKSICDSNVTQWVGEAGDSISVNGNPPNK